MQDQMVVRLMDGAEFPNWLAVSSEFWSSYCGGSGIQCAMAIPLWYHDPKLSYCLAHVLNDGCDTQSLFNPVSFGECGPLMPHRF